MNAKMTSATKRRAMTVSPKAKQRRVREEEPGIYSAGVVKDADPADEAILARAEAILASRFARIGSITDSNSAGKFLRMRLAPLMHEEFHCLWLDNQHRVISCDRMFNGTVDGSAVHPREVVRAAISHNAAAVILAHNHPSGVAKASPADHAITKRLQDALSTIDVRVVDHLIVGQSEPQSFARMGWL